MKPQFKYYILLISVFACLFAKANQQHFIIIREKNFI